MKENSAENSSDCIAAGVGVETRQPAERWFSGLLVWKWVAVYSDLPVEELFDDDEPSDFEDEPSDFEDELSDFEDELSDFVSLFVSPFPSVFVSELPPFL